MFKWKKIGRIFNPETDIKDGLERPWMNLYSQCTSTLLFDNFIRVYFSCRSKEYNDGIHNEYDSYTAFVDLDRKDITKVINIAKKPVMPLGELGTFDQFGVYPTCVVPRDGKVWFYFGGWSRCRAIPYTVSIGVAISEDTGETFERLGKGPILTNSLLEPFELSGPKVRLINGTWYMYYLAGEKWTMSGIKADSTYKIRLATSVDGIEWKKLNANIIPDALDEPECQAGPDVFFKDGLYHMFFSYRHALNFRNNERGYRIGYAFSSDAIDWTRDDSQVGIDISDSGWDSQMQHYPHVFEMDGKTYMLYNGNNFGRYGFGAAILEE